jgi:hypothetical protein
MAKLKLHELSELMRDIDFVMLQTRIEGGNIAGRPMSNNRDVEYNGDSFFFRRRAPAPSATLEMIQMSISLFRAAGVCSGRHRPSSQSRAEPKLSSTRSNLRRTGILTWIAGSKTPRHAWSCHDQGACLPDCRESSSEVAARAVSPASRRLLASSFRA